jgi:hypothetical protein
MVLSFATYVHLSEARNVRRIHISTLIARAPARALCRQGHSVLAISSSGCLANRKGATSACTDADF